MRFQPKSEADIARENLLPVGDYDFTVLEASDERSKSGNDMIKLKLEVWDNDGNTRHVYDYLLEQMAFKLRHFCSATGLIELYEQGDLQAIDCENRSGRCKIIIKTDKTGEHDPNNAVKDYLVPDAANAPEPVRRAQPAQQQATGTDDELPF